MFIFSCRFFCFGDSYRGSGLRTRCLYVVVSWFFVRSFCIVVFEVYIWFVVFLVVLFDESVGCSLDFVWTFFLDW